MFDIHAHLFWKSYDADRDEVVERARATGVTKMICVGTEPMDNPLAIKMAEKYDGVFAAVGIHPHYFNESRIKNQESGWENELETLVQHKKVIAIGECGLDYHSHSDNPITEEQKIRQQEGFLIQLQIAKRQKLPVIIHCRDAYQKMYEILKNHNSQFPILDSRFILHCYQGDTEITKKFLELENVFFSFAGNITYPVKKVFVGTKDDLSETVKLVPLERLFVETDCPFLAPQGKRGERNEPAFVVETARFLASLKGVSIDELNQKVTENSERVFWE